MKHPTPSVIALIAVNALFFLATYFVTDMQVKMTDLFALHFPQSEDMRIWQFVSHMFMHGSFAHIMFNMFALLSFGGALETIWGTRRFLIFYFVAGLGAGLVYTGVNFYQFNSVYDALIANGYTVGDIQHFLDTTRIDSAKLGHISQENLQQLYSIRHSTVVGASGAIYGVLVAFTLLFPNAKLSLLFIPVPIAAKYLVSGLLVFDLFSGVTGFSLFGHNVAHSAHIGGATIGFLLMLYWKKTLPSRNYR